LTRGLGRRQYFFLYFFVVERILLAPPAQRHFSPREDASSFLSQVSTFLRNFFPCLPFPADSHGKRMVFTAFLHLRLYPSSLGNAVADSLSLPPTSFSVALPWLRFDECFAPTLAKIRVLPLSVGCFFSPSYWLSDSPYPFECYLLPTNLRRTFPLFPPFSGTSES